jgi:hypothetical protein
MKYLLALLVLIPFQINVEAKSYTIIADEYNGAIVPYITLYSTYTQKIAATNAVQYLELNSHSNGDGEFTQISKSTWSVVYPGVYEFCYSGIADLTGLPAGEIEIWGRINGVDVADSNTIVSVVTAATEQTVALCWIGPLNAGDQFAAMTYGSDTDLQWLYTAAQTTPARPATPSFIMTVKKVSGLH